jgi:hypothetical protein
MEGGEILGDALHAVQLDMEGCDTFYWHPANLIACVGCGLKIKSYKGGELFGYQCQVDCDYIAGEFLHCLILIFPLTHTLQVMSLRSMMAR